MNVKWLEFMNRDLSEPTPIRQQPALEKKGLTSAQAERLLASYGENRLKSGKKVKALPIFVSQFRDALVMILLISTAASIFMGELVEAISIAVIVLANAIMGFIQEFKTEKTLEALKQMSAPMAKVYRNGELVRLETEKLVPGDVIEIEAGDRIPADAILLESVSLQTDESVLTGESVPVHKQENSSAALENKLNQPYLVYMGTTVTKGHGKAQIISTGMSTQMGKIAHMLSEIKEDPTPLQNKLNELGKLIGIGCLAVSAIVAMAGLLRGEPLMQMIITGVSLAVAAVPEGLPAIVTISLALAVKRMIRRKALIRKLHAVETLGCTGVICSDKTGTLTENKMTVQQLITFNQSVEISHDNQFIEQGVLIKPTSNPTYKRILEICVLCNNAQLQHSHQKGKSGWKAVGEPTETALLLAAAKAGITSESLKTEYVRMEEIPFDSTRKCMSVIVKDKAGQEWIFTKGAYDVILEKSSRIQQGNTAAMITPADKKRLEQQNNKMAGSGMRVLGFAYAPVSGTPQEKNLIFLGLSGMMDPPRKEAKQAVITCRKAGVKTVMITGDHKLTACAIAKQIGIYQKGDLCLTGRELEKMSDQDLDHVVQKVTVFARVSPSHKLKIVRSLKRKGNVIAMTGDGVNDAPAIKEANIGVSMGITGSDVTKQAADVILLDDNFSTLVAAIEEGRVIYQNIRKFIRYLLSCNIGEVLTMFAGMLMGMPVPLLPMQILLVNLVTDGLPAISLGLDPAEKDVMKQRPRHPEESIFAHGLVYTIIFRGVLIGLTTLTVFITMFRMTLSVDAARTGAFFTLVLTQLIHVFECKSETKSIFSIPLFNNMKLVGSVLISAIIVLLAIYLPQCNLLFRTVPLSGIQLLLCFGISMVVPICNAIFLAVKKSFHKKDMLIATPEQAE